MSSDQTTETTAPDYRGTVFLPETDFPMRAGLPQREPDWLARWEKIGVYDRLREKAAKARAAASCSMTARPMRTAICISATR